MIPWLCKPGDLGFGSLFSRLLDPLLLFLADMGILSFVPAGRDKAGQPIGLLSEQPALSPFFTLERPPVFCCMAAEKNLSSRRYLFSAFMKRFWGGYFLRICEKEFKEFLFFFRSRLCNPYLWNPIRRGRR